MIFFCTESNFLKSRARYSLGCKGISALSQVFWQNSFSSCNSLLKCKQKYIYKLNDFIFLTYPLYSVHLPKLRYWNFHKYLRWPDACHGILMEVRCLGDFYIAFPLHNKFFICSLQDREECCCLTMSLCNVCPLYPRHQVDFAV